MPNAAPRRAARGAARAGAAAAALAGAHAAVVLAGAARVSERLPGERVARALSAYVAWTGAGSHYGFFSPAIPDQVVAEVTTEWAGGAVSVDTVGRGRTAYELRYAAMMSVFQKAAAFELLGRTLAAHALAADGAARARVRLLRHRVPTLAAASHGARPADEWLHTGAYERAAAP